MNFNKHSNLEGCHAFLGASNYHWLNYDEEQLIRSYRNAKAKIQGTKLHEFARQCIELNQKLPRSSKTLNQYVNDAIGFMMTPEQPLYFSDNCFGTTDAISFRKNFLRIHDLKTGSTPAHMEQLYIYAALFCLEYGINPKDIECELRLYQSNDMVIDNPTAGDLLTVTDKIIESDKIVKKLQQEEG